MMPLTIQHQFNDNHSLLVLAGTLNQHTAADLVSAWENHSPHQGLTLDLSQITQLTPSGLHQLWMLIKPWVDCGTAVTLITNDTMEPLITFTQFNWLSDETCRLYETQSVHSP